MEDVHLWSRKLARNVLIYKLVFWFWIQMAQSVFQDDRLTEVELQQMFGSWRPTEYSIFRPKFGPMDNGSRRKRESEADSSIFEFDALGETFRFRLEPVNDLVSAEFALLGRNDTNSYFLDKEMPNCAFQGRDDNQRSRAIALVMCGNLRGVVISPRGELLIEPLPETIVPRLQRRHYRGRRSPFSLKEHIIYRRKDKTSCSLNDGSSVFSLDQLGRDYLHSRYSSVPSLNHPTPMNGKGDRMADEALTAKDREDDNSSYSSGETYYIETAVFVDRDLLEHMRTNFPSNTEEEVIQVVLAMINAVQLLYNDPSLGHRIKFVLKRLELLYQDPRGLFRPHDIDDFLTKFCSWQHLENPLKDEEPFHWDHALILTGLDLYTVIDGGKINAQVVGLAPVAGMCTRTSSCTVNEGRHFESVYVVAHEIGHNLGMRHDGFQSGNNCDPSGYLMSPTLGSGKVTWSHCSKRYLSKFMDTPQAKCMRDKPRRPSKEMDHEGPLFPGQRFSADQQCMLKYGVGSRSSLSQQDNEICRDLHCIRDHYTWTSHPALEGTSCGENKWCRRGNCIRKERAEQQYNTQYRAKQQSSVFSPNSQTLDLTTMPHSSPPSTGVGGEWGRWSECLSPCLYGTDGILSSGSTGLSLSERQCHSCQGEFRYRACSAVRECSIRQKKTIQDYADDICRRLKLEDPSLQGFSVRLPVTGIRHCEIECLSSTRPPMSTMKSFPDGTVCHSDATNFPTYCMSGYCTEFRCESNALYGAGANICRSYSLPEPRPLPSPKAVNTPRTSSPKPPYISPNMKDRIDDVTSQPVTDNSWGPWLPSSECRYSCMSPSKGIQLVSRACLRAYGCDGLNRNIQLCSPDQDECNSIQSPFSYASDICERYSKSVHQLSGIGMQLSSTLADPNRGCIVACQDATLNYRFYKVNGKDGWFPFGTACSSKHNGYEAFCLNGKCLEFDSDGTPLRKKGDYMASNNKSSRSLLLFDYRPMLQSLSFLKPIPEDDVTLLHWRFKRDVLSTSHRLPGSFEDAFLLSLVDEINATFVENRTDNVQSKVPVDLENPLFYGESLNDSRHQRNKRKELDTVVGATRNTKLQPQSTSTSYKWIVKSLPCSATCGEGSAEQKYYCVDNSERLVDDIFCLKLMRPKLPLTHCSTIISCSKPSKGEKRLLSNRYTTDSARKTSPFGQWLIGLVHDIKLRVH